MSRSVHDAVEPRLRHRSTCLDKLDGIGWPETRVFTAYGRTVGLRVTDPEVTATVLTRLPSALRPSRARRLDRLYSIVVGDDDPAARPRRLSLGYADWARLARSRTLADVLGAVEIDARRYVAEHATRHVFVHAGVVAVDGRAVVIPGRSFTGKSTLVAALIRRGAVYYSDEYAVFDRRGRVHPYLKPLSLRDGIVATDVPVEAIGGISGSAPLPLGAVLEAPYHEDAMWSPTAQSPARTVLALIRNTVAVRRQPAETMQTLQRAVVEGGAMGWRGRRGDADATAAALIERLSAPATR